MRNPNRLDGFYEEIKKLHKKYVPDWRFGQLYWNFYDWMTKTKRKDIFFPEENEMIEYLKEYLKSIF